MTPILFGVLHVFVMAVFAISQPVLHTLSRRLVFLNDTRCDPIGLVLFVALVVLVIPASIAAVVYATSWFGSRVYSVVHGFFVSLLAFLLAVPAIHRTKELSGLVVVGLGLLAAVLFWLAYRRWSAIRSLVSFSTIGVAVFPAAFVFYSSVTPLFFPPDTTATRVQVENPVPLVLIVFDEFCGVSIMDKDGNVDSRRCPNFAKLASHSTWYRNATAVHPRTDNALPAILTGKWPRNAPPTVTEHPVNLFTVLRASELYEPVAFEPFSRLFPRAFDTEVRPPRTKTQQLGSLASTVPIVYLHQWAPPDLRFLLPDIPKVWFGLEPRYRGVDRSKRLGLFRYSWNMKRPGQFEHFLDCIGPSEKPRLYFNHVVLPHFPWYFLPSGRQYAEDLGSEWVPLGTAPQRPDEGVAETWLSDELAIARAHQRYLLQVGFVDHLLGRMFDRLKEAGIYDECLLIVMADHGVSFRPNQSRRAPPAESIADIMSIPLFIKLPGQTTGEQSDRNVESIDILPTIFDVLKVQFPLESDGVSLVNRASDERPIKRFVLNHAPLTLPGDFQAKYETLDRMKRMFGAGEFADGLYRVGPFPELLGRKVDDFAGAKRSGWKVLLHTSDHPLSYSADSFVPCWVKGALDPPGRIRSPMTLAVAVNGTIRATTRTFQWAAMKDRFSAIVPEEAFGPAKNDVRLYIVNKTTSGFQLEETATGMWPQSVQFMRD